MTSIGQKTASGFLWMVAQTVSTRVLNLLGQIALAWLLLPEDFGLISLAYTVTAFASVFQQLGLHFVLIQRQAHFRRWGNAGFWMSLTAGLASSVLILVAAPFAVWSYGNPQLWGLLLLLAMGPIIEGFGLVPSAWAQAQMRFRLLSAVATGSIAINVLVSIVLAWAGWGAASFAIGQLAGSLGRVALLWMRSPVRVRLNPQVRRWRYLLGDTGMMFGSSIFNTVLFQGDYILLGIVHSETVVGVYYFAYRLSTQALQLLSVSLGGVLFPALSKLQHDPKRQAQAFLNASRALAMVGIPACVLQAALADPLIRLIFEPKWYEAIPILQVLSVGMAMRIILPASLSLIRAQGRFRMHLIATGLAAGLFLILTTIGVFFGAAMAVAVATATTFIVISPIVMYIAVRPAGVTWQDVTGILIPPLALTAATFGVAVGVAQSLPTTTVGQVGRAALITLLAIGLYVPCARWLMPQAWAQLALRIRGLRSQEDRQSLKESVAAE